MNRSKESDRNEQREESQTGAQQKAHNKLEICISKQQNLEIWRMQRCFVVTELHVLRPRESSNLGEPSDMQAIWMDGWNFGKLPG